MKNSDMPAMPSFKSGQEGKAANTTFHAVGGLTKREHFAGLAMQAMLGNSRMEYYPIDLVKEAIVHADALLSELEK